MRFWLKIDNLNEFHAILIILLLRVNFTDNYESEELRKQMFDSSDLTYNTPYACAR
jgi:hypothetical protein